MQRETTHAKQIERTVLRIPRGVALTSMIPRDDRRDRFTFITKWHTPPEFPLRIVETLRHDPHRLGPPSALQSRSVSTAVNPGGDIVERPITIVTSAVAEIFVHICVVRLGPLSVHRDRIRVNHEDVRSVHAIFNEIVVFAVEDKRDRMIPVDLVERVIRELGRVEIVISSVGLISRVPNEDVGSITEVFDLVFE